MTTLMDCHPKYVTDEEGRKTAVLLSLNGRTIDTRQPNGYIKDVFFKNHTASS